MDVGNPSNMERLRWLFPDLAALRRKVTAQSVSDEEIRATIQRGLARAFAHFQVALGVFKHHN